jgi:hypothetical protein
MILEEFSLDCNLLDVFAKHKEPIDIIGKAVEHNGTACFRSETMRNKEFYAVVKARLLPSIDDAEALEKSS